MYRIRLYPQHSYRSYNSFPRSNYRSYGNYAPRYHSYSLHVVNTPWNYGRRRGNAQLAAYRAQIEQGRLEARLQSQYGASSLYNQGLYTNPGVYGGLGSSPYGGLGISQYGGGYNQGSLYSGYSAPALGYGSYGGAVSGYGNGAWSDPNAGLLSSSVYQSGFGY